jgi:tetratricopeptide (TPR) repeat protein
MLPVVVLASVVAAAANVPPIADVQKQLRAIEEAIAKGDVDRLRLSFKEQATNRPGDVMLRIYQAWCDMPSDESWNNLKAIAALNPENPWVHQGMGRIYTRWKMGDQAMASFDLALKVNPSFFPAMVGRGDLLRSQGKFEDAKTQYKKALAINDDAQAHSGLGLSLLALGDNAGAKTELAKAIELWPAQPEALGALSKVYLDAKDSKAAATYMEKMAALAPKDRAARKALGDVKFDAGDKAGAAKEYEAFIALGAADSDVLKRLGAIYKELGKADAEESVLKKLEGLDRESADAPYRLGVLLEAKGDLEAAETELVEATARDGKRADIQLKLARVRAQRDRMREALEAYRAAIAIGGPTADEARKEADELAKKFKLSAKPAKGSIDKIYATVSSSLNAFYTERLRAKPGLAGTLKLRVKIDKEGKVVSVDPLEDTVGDPLIDGHIYFALKEAQYPPARREPVFEFELRPPNSAAKGK